MGAAMLRSHDKLNTTHFNFCLWSNNTNEIILITIVHDDSPTTLGVSPRQLALRKQTKNTECTFETMIKTICL